jgi:hypothetical protein
MDEVIIREVSFRRKFNLGNHETCDIEMVATIGPGQKPGEVLEAINRKIMVVKHELYDPVSNYETGGAG